MNGWMVVAVLAAGALGSVLRYAAALLWASAVFPWGVLVVNVVGSAVAGASIGLADAGGIDPGVLLIIVTGLCGGLTTFSTLSVQTIQLVQDGHATRAALSCAANFTFGIGAAAAAFVLIRMLAHAL